MSPLGRRILALETLRLLQDYDSRNCADLQASATDGAHRSAPSSLHAQRCERAAQLHPQTIHHAKPSSRSLQPATLARLARVVLAGVVLSLVLGSAAQAATFVVNSTADTGGTTCSTSCTLRQAIGAANATTTADTINFGFRFPVRGEILIQPATALPTITQPLTINGYSQSGTAVNTDPVVSNAVLRIRVDGANAGAGVRGITACANNVTIKGLSVTRFTQTGIAFGVSNPGVCSGVFTGANVLGNFIGLGADGSTALGNSIGMEFRESSGNIGSASIADRNVIGSNTANGIGMSFSGSSNTQILNNLIGTDKTGVLARGNRNGISVSDVGNTTIGNLGAPNLIANNTDAGFDTANSSVITGLNNKIFANRFFANGELAIELKEAGAVTGVTANDNFDSDTGPNGLQNYLDDGFTATRVSNGIRLQGNLRAPPSGTISYTFAAYASASCDGSGHGEGEQFLGATTVSAPPLGGASASGARPINVVIASAQPPFGSFVTNTVTGPDGTSEFSSCVQLEVPLVVNSNNDVADGVCNAAHCSLRDALIVSNQNSNPDLIQFAIAPLTGTSEILIQPTSPLPAITAPVTIDGYSQPGTSLNTLPITDFASNAVLRIRLDGSNAGLSTSGLSVCADGVTIQGLAVSGFEQKGVAFGVDNGNVFCANPIASGNVLGSFIGLRADGVVDGPGNGVGILVRNAKVSIGSSLAKDRNVIGGNNNEGIDFDGIQSGQSGAFGNLIGTDKTGTQSRLNPRGIQITNNAANVTIGSAAAPNLIRSNNRGIVLQSTAGSNNVLLHNRFLLNVAPIDLNNNGVTTNDNDDSDTGPNGLQNFPVLIKAERTSTGIRVQGTLDVKTTTFNQLFTIGVYANAACDSSGHGEGEFYLGSATVLLSDGVSGQAFSFVLNTDVDLVANAQITTTATGLEGTSEFSQCLTATDVPPGIVVDTDIDSATLNGGCDVALDGNTCTLREAITLANSQNGADLIRFEMPESLAPFNIVLVSSLPVITEALELDGYSQLGAAENGAEQGSDAAIVIGLDGNNVAQNGFRTCTTGSVQVRGFAFNRFTTAAINTAINDSASCDANINNGLTVVQGNFFGTNLDGTSGSNVRGILINNTPHQIGGTELPHRNVFSNHTQAAVRVAGVNAGNASIVNNVFGRDPSLTSGTANVLYDLEINGSSNVIIGGEGRLMNRFFFSPVGVLVTGAATGVTAYANEYEFMSGATAIDLSNTGVVNGITANDLNDTDSGPNNLQNAPVLSSATALTDGFNLQGTVDLPIGIVAPDIYTIAVYESTSCNDSSGSFTNGREGRIYLGAKTVGLTSTAQSFNLSYNVAPPSFGNFITATVTAPDGSTSEFSNCLAAPRPETIFADGFE